MDQPLGPELDCPEQAACSVLEGAHVEPTVDHADNEANAEADTTLRKVRREKSQEGTGLGAEGVEGLDLGRKVMGVGRFVAAPIVQAAMNEL